MKNNQVVIPKKYLVVIMLLGWFALLSQLYLILQNGPGTIIEIVIRYFSFFTILTNLIVVICSTVLFFKKKNGFGYFFSRPSTVTAITVYITIVGVVYNVILRFLWQPQGLQYVTDELLHTVIPILFILIWFLFVPKNELKYKNVFGWLIYPFVYIIYIALRGYITGEYPYPFINVGQLGYFKTAINTGILVIAFLALSIFLVAIGKFI
ncbi:MAG TPA: Pr6Pr family membrane protein, partial [Ferruginibacter sp.]|nr:Pr6Pr family membrane protein [Ferruginibacter sp.]